MDKFISNIVGMYGDAGKAWIEQLPQLVGTLQKKWGLSDLSVVDNLSFNYIVSGLQNNLPIILKISIDNKSLNHECAALDAFQGFGVVEVIDKDFEQNALLMQRAVPGIPLQTLVPERDVEAIEIACTVIDKLHKAPIPVSNNFPLLKDWLNIIDRDWELPHGTLHKARELKTELLKTSNSQVLLHGDLHHDNILSNGKGWLVIDPKGVIGDPIFDKVGCLIREPIGKILEIPNASALIKNRVKVVDKYFNLDAKRILSWTYLQTVMAMCWSLEDKQDIEGMIKFLDILTHAIK